MNEPKIKTLLELWSVKQKKHVVPGVSPKYV